nr:uncharacterized protein LOC107456658 [Parasteatoda tepidariorum]
MRSCAVFSFFLSAVAAVLWPGTAFWKNNQPSFTKVCLYSTDPIKFTPKCILCPNTLYPIVLTTCVMGTAIPLNVSYTQANCIVGNCAVNMNPKIQKIRREIDETVKEPSETESDASELFGNDFPSDFVEDSFRSVPYTMLVDGYNVTITNVEEYYVQPDEQPDEDSLDDELE